MDATGVALVVGAGSGIGLETALLFAERGARAVAFADKNADAAREAAEKSRKLAICSAYQALAIEVDVADHESVRRMIAKTVEEFVKIDYAVNSAGLPRMQPNPITEVSFEEFDQLHSVNCKGILHCLREELKVMQAQDQTYVEGRSGRRGVGRGSIINVVSLAGVVGIPNGVTYTASKFAANAVSKIAAMENGSEHIRINSLCPGFTDTPILRKGLEREPEMAEKIIQAQPLQRVATVEEIANVAYFLATPAASFVNGQAWVVDSGISLQVKT